MMMPSGPLASPPGPPGPFGGGRPHSDPMLATLPPSTVTPPSVRAIGSSITCPRCGTPTPLGFAYCQQCGLHMSALHPTDPGENARPRAPSSPGSLPPVRPSTGQQPPIDQHAVTLASDGARAPSGQQAVGQAGGHSGGLVPGPAPGAVAVHFHGPNAAASAAPRPQTGPAWGTAVLVNRDGSDGQRYPLSGEYLVIGRAGADIAFDEDRFLARQHARIERGADGSIKVLPIDNLNGVFRKTDAPVDLVDGMTILVGREVLRYERVDPEETKVHPLTRHGVSLFGSPPREPWGRLFQIVPSGGYRDVRHLAGEEIVLGREEGDIVFRDDAFMSRRHAAVTWNGTRAQITDLGSSNGTFVRVEGATPLKHGDHVRMGDQLLRIELGR